METLVILCVCIIALLFCVVLALAYLLFRDRSPTTMAAVAPMFRDEFSLAAAVKDLLTAQIRTQQHLLALVDKVHLDKHMPIMRPTMSSPPPVVARPVPQDRLVPGGHVGDPLQWEKFPDEPGQV